MQLAEAQIKILSKFVVAESLRYSEGKPDEMTNDLYKYHLKFLIQKGYILKQGEKYTLTNKGKQFGNEISPQGELLKPFFVCVLDLVLIRENSTIKVLVQKRRKHLYQGETALITGKVLTNEPVNNAAKRKLYEETGLTADFKYIGMLRVVRFDKEGLPIDKWFNICLTEHVKGELKADTDWGYNYFADLKDIDINKNPNATIQNLNTIIDRINSNDYPFFIEYGLR